MKKFLLILLSLLLLLSFSVNVGCKKLEEIADVIKPSGGPAPDEKVDIMEPGRSRRADKWLSAPQPPTLPPRTPSAPSLSEIVENELKNLSKGRILFNPPQEMKVGVKERVEARITKTITEDLSKGLKGSGLPQIEKIRVNTLMGVRLRGDDNFDIKALSDEDQIVTREGFTQWDWDVMPLKSGVQSLLLTVTVRIKILNYGEERKNYPVYERRIKVKVNPSYTINKFIKSYWQWIITAILIPIIGWFANKWRKSRKKK